MGTSSVGCGTYSTSFIRVSGSLQPYEHLFVTAHEAGHQLGLDEAMGRSYAHAPLGAPEDNGTRTTYFDPFTPMGNYDIREPAFPGTFGHYNARQQFQLGWLTESDVPTIQQPGSFRISPLGSPSGPLKALRIERPGTDGDVWLEYRQPSGQYESRLPPQGYTGALAHYESYVNRGHYSTDLLDFTPGSSPDLRIDFRDPALASGLSWSDPWSPLSVAITGADSNGLSIDVTQSSCATLASPSDQFDWTPQTASVQVQAPAACQWSVISSQPWVTVTSGESGKGNGTVSYAVDVNPDRVRRQATLSIGRQPFGIIQERAPQSLPKAVRPCPIRDPDTPRSLRLNTPTPTAPTTSPAPKPASSIRPNAIAPWSSPPPPRRSACGPMPTVPDSRRFPAQPALSRPPTAPSTWQAPPYRNRATTCS
ncbi:MAG: hypothetical protein ACHQ5A_12670 [Opitutales bacterium]